MCCLSCVTKWACSPLWAGGRQWRSVCLLLQGARPWACSASAQFCARAPDSGSPMALGTRTSRQWGRVVWACLVCGVGPSPLERTVSCPEAGFGLVHVHLEAGGTHVMVPCGFSWGSHHLSGPALNPHCHKASATGPPPRHLALSLLTPRSIQPLGDPHTACDREEAGRGTASHKELTFWWEEAKNQDQGELQ